MKGKNTDASHSSNLFEANLRASEKKKEFSVLYNFFVQNPNKWYERLKIVWKMEDCAVNDRQKEIIDWCKGEMWVPDNVRFENLFDAFITADLEEDVETKEEVFCLVMNDDAFPPNYKFSIEKIYNNDNTVLLPLKKFGHVVGEMKNAVDPYEKMTEALKCIKHGSEFDELNQILFSSKIIKFKEKQ